MSPTVGGITAIPNQAGVAGSGAPVAPPGGAFARALAQAAAPGPTSAARTHAGAPPPAIRRTVTLGQMLGLERSSSPLPRAGVSTGAAHPPPAPSGGDGGALVSAARRYLGVDYRWGGTDPTTGLDCSGLVQLALADLGVQAPRTSAEQARFGQPVASMAEARPGDLVFWLGRGGRPNHIGIYVGDGQMLHAPRTGDVVRIGPMRRSPPDAIRRAY